MFYLNVWYTLLMYESIECHKCGKSIIIRHRNSKFCTDCRKAKDEETRKKWSKKNPERIRKYAKQSNDRYREKHGCSAGANWQKENRNKANKWQLKYYYKNHDIQKKQKNCRRRTLILLKQRGITVYNQNCEICEKAAEVIHHEDYSNPFDVMYMCKECHYNLHILYNKSMLTKYKNDNQLTWGELAKKIKISRQSLSDIVTTRSPKIKVVTTMRIKAVTGLDPWDYLDGLEDLKHLFKSI